ncbi:hypothetical protein [Microscilla marina]|uniref:Uncharacterized protein n=1 Tax=Microscilla marina ATCC 23134 TaxID=313606 RepID=A1ZP75_MICM2|nr:hypothetical protein [Microscilla marina]EAY27867.1 hypothetical protein M23134_00308 [Microscilla marina ATCC 23134]
MRKIKKQDWVLNKAEMAQITGGKHTSSIGGSTEPLYIIDGVPTDGNLSAFTNQSRKLSIRTGSGQPGASSSI